MTEEVVEMGTKPKKTRAKAITREELDAMFAKHDEEIAIKINSICDNCSHHECDCPQKIEALDDYSEARMNQLDENDDLLRQGINDLADKTEEDVQKIRQMLEEEHRLRVVSEQKIDALMTTNNNNSKVIIEQRGKLEEYEKTLKRNSSDVVKLGIIAGACLGVALIILAVFLVG